MKFEDELFWAKVAFGDGCWEWQGTTAPPGYGRLGRDGKAWSAHRRAFYLATGSLAIGLHVLHKCDNPLCVRPSHLFLGTAATNARDRTRKGRSNPWGAAGKPKGEE